MSKIRVLIADDHSLFRDGLAAILNGQPDFEVIGEATNGQEALDAMKEKKPDMVLMDISMPVLDGLEATRLIKQAFPQVTIVVLTASEEDDKLFEAIRNGAQGYLLKNIRRQDMLAMLRGAVQGEAAISPLLGGRMLEEFRRISKHAQAAPNEKDLLLSGREQEVLVLVASGATNKEIAETLSISIHTVRSHMRKLLGKLQLTNRREATSFARREGLIGPPPIK